MTNITRRSAFKASLATLATAGLAVNAKAATTVDAQNSVQTPFALPARTFIGIEGSKQVFPVRRIYCIGRNYEAHAREMGSDPNREPPFFFQKPTDAIQYVAKGTVAEHPYPSLTKNYHYEVELVACLKSGGKNIAVEHALEHVFGYALGLDMTRRDLQRALGDQKKPWEIGKSFDHSAPVGPIIPAPQFGAIKDQNISLTVNGQLKQQAKLNQMTWSVAEQIAQLSQANELFAGDIIYSGTPENVGPVVKGDTIVCKLDGLPDLSIKIV